MSRGPVAGKYQQTALRLTSCTRQPGQTCLSWEVRAPCRPAVLPLPAPSRAPEQPDPASASMAWLQRQTPSLTPCGVRCAAQGVSPMVWLSPPGSCRPWQYFFCLQQGQDAVETETGTAGDAAAVRMTDRHPARHATRPSHAGQSEGDKCRNTGVCRLSACVSAPVRQHAAGPGEIRRSMRLPNRS